VKRRVKDLTGEELDAAVALAEGWRLLPDRYGWERPRSRTGVAGELIQYVDFHAEPLHFSTEWEHGGPIIERERIGTAPLNDGWGATVGDLISSDGPTVDAGAYGPTALIATMRAWVQAKFGDEIELV
jgi:hypothetical protein